jgi:hypothetical protein
MVEGRRRFKPGLIFAAYFGLNAASDHGPPIVEVVLWGHRLLNIQ